MGLGLRECVCVCVCVCVSNAVSKSLFVRCRGHGGLVLSHANEATELDWKGDWTQSPVPARNWHG